MSIFSHYIARYEEAKEEELTIQEYLQLCKSDPTAFATPAERMLKAIGEPEMVDTRNDTRMSRLFSNKVLKIYPAFREFYGMEDVIEQIAHFEKMVKDKKLTSIDFEISDNAIELALDQPANNLNGN